MNHFVNRPPTRTILPDNHESQDCFSLNRKIGPLFDILRHPGTHTPLTAAIYGEWGIGKTFALRWLQRALEMSNKLELENVVRVHSIWFNPWKYNSKEAVWRGLIAEVILGSINVKDVTREQFIDSALRLAQCLGRNFLNLLAMAKFKVGPSVAAVEFTPDFNKIIQDFEKTNHPELTYLNEFEVTFKNWVQNTLGQARLVILVDDLDRCQPSVALELLDSLKLYFDIPQLAFVVAIDPSTIDQLVKKQYEAFGFSSGRESLYLAKMFQLELRLIPVESEIGEYIDRSLDAVMPDLTEDEKQTIKAATLALAERNPREIKRLINSAALTGAQAEYLDEGPVKLKFIQGVQQFFIYKAIKERFSQSGLERQLGQDVLTQFFRTWSTLTQRNSGWLPGWSREFSTVRPINGNVVKADYQNWVREHTRALPALVELLPEDPEKLTPAHELLGDEIIAELMRIEYPQSTSLFQLVDEMPSLSLDWVTEYSAKVLKKVPDNLTPADLLKVTRLVADNKGIRSLGNVTFLKNLQVIHASNNPELFDLSGLSSLYNLRELYANRTRIQDLTPLWRLKSLERIQIQNTMCADLLALSELHNLWELAADNSSVRNLSPIGSLQKLTSLSVSNTAVEEFNFSSLPNLESIDAFSARLKTLDGLQYCPKLKSLQAYDNRLSDLGPLAACENLEYLAISKNNLSSIESLRHLNKICLLQLDCNPIEDLSPLKGLIGLRELHIRQTGVRDLSPLLELPNLKSVFVDETLASEKNRQGLKERNIGVTIITDKYKDRPTYK